MKIGGDVIWNATNFGNQWEVTKSYENIENVIKSYKQVVDLHKSYNHLRNIVITRYRCNSISAP